MVARGADCGQRRVLRDLHRAHDLRRRWHPLFHAVRRRDGLDAIRAKSCRRAGAGLERGAAGGRGLHEFSLDAVDGPPAPAAGRRRQDIAARDAVGRRHSRGQPRSRVADRGAPRPRFAARRSGGDLADGALLPAHLLDAARHGSRPGHADALDRRPPRAAVGRSLFAPRRDRARGGDGGRCAHPPGRDRAMRRRRGVRGVERAEQRSAAHRRCPRRGRRRHVRHPDRIPPLVLRRSAAEYLLPESRRCAAVGEARPRAAGSARHRRPALARAGCARWRLSGGAGATALRGARDISPRRAVSRRVRLFRVCRRRRLGLDALRESLRDAGDAVAADPDGACARRMSPAATRS